MSLNAPNIANMYFDFISRSQGMQNLAVLPESQKIPKNEVSIFYFNDLHAQMPKLSQLKTASDSFTKIYDNQLHTDTFKISGGDANIGSDTRKNKFLVQFLNLIGLDFSAIGNHELDDKSSNFSENIKDANYRYISSNIEIDKNSPLENSVKNKKIVDSWITNKNNHIYGFIGVSPVELKERINPLYGANDVNVKNPVNTLKEVQKEVNEFKSKGINRIILVSHLGYQGDVLLAKNISGIDIIIGGHTHDLINGVIPEINQIESPSGEPVIITQAGKDGNYFGILNAVFDEKDRVISANNIVHKTNNYKKDDFVEFAKESILGKPESIGTLSQIDCPQNVLTEENPLAGFIADSMKNKANTQIALINSTSLRSKLEPGVITTRNIQDLTPITNKICKVELSEKDIIDALNAAAKSTSTPMCKPGLLQVSGLKYTVTSQKNVKDVFIENSDGTYSKLDHISPSPDKKFTAAYNDFLINGPEGLISLKKSPLEIFNWDSSASTIEYIKKFNNSPFEIKNEKRIIVET